MARRKIVGTYENIHFGEQTQRNVEDLELVWNQLRPEEWGPVQYDHLLSQAIEQAVAAGRTELTVMDIGSGYGFLLWNTGEYLGEFPKVEKILADHPQFKIKMVGFTDAQDPDLFLKETKLSQQKQEVLQKDEGPVEAHNYHYTLTATQTLDEFLREIGVDGVDLMFATWSLTYVGPKTFQRVLEDIATHLTPGGKVLVSAYGEDPPGFSRGFMGLFSLKANDKYYLQREKVTQQPELILKYSDSMADAIKVWSSGLLRAALLSKDQPTPDVIDQPTPQVVDQPSPEVMDKACAYLEQIAQFLQQLELISQDEIKQTLDESLTAAKIPRLTRLGWKIKELFSPIGLQRILTLNLEQQAYVMRQISFSLNRGVYKWGRKRALITKEQKKQILNEFIDNHPELQVKYTNNHIQIDKHQDLTASNSPLPI